MARLAALCPRIEARAALLDREGLAPLTELGWLQEEGILQAPLPRDHGGEGAGTEPEGALACLDLLRLLGRANLSLARLVEGHVNAVRLVHRYGEASQMARLAAALTRPACAFALAAIWVTEAPPGLALEDGRLRGGKSVCSGAGIATHALVTAGEPAQMLLIDLAGGGVAGTPVRLQGMRAACTAAMDLTGIAVPAEAELGGPGDYLRQPEFSAGAWRGSAAALGGIEALVERTTGELRARGRAGEANQKRRIGEMLIARETARDWVRRAAWAAEVAQALSPEDVSACVNLARIAVEMQALEVLRLCQRALGLSAFVEANGTERVMRDLATYLRQPAPDEALAEAAARFTEVEMPRW